MTTIDDFYGNFNENIVANILHTLKPKIELENAQIIVSKDTKNVIVMGGSYALYLEIEILLIGVFELEYIP